MNLRSMIFALALLVTLSLASTASAAIRYAVPGNPSGSTISDCNPVACSLDAALNPYYTKDGDEIILAKGNYTNSTQRALTGDLHIHGIGKPEETKINATTAGNYWLILSDERLKISDLEIDGSSDATPLYVEFGTANRVIVRNTSGDACGLRYGLIADSLCHTSAPGHSAVRSSLEGGYNAQVLAGVTAVASSPLGGYGINLTSNGMAGIDFTGFGTIASGATADIRTEFLDTLPGYKAIHMNMVVSNYNSTDYAAGTTLQTSALSSNQSAEPKFVNAAAGDFRETACSPTIGAAVASGYSEGTDLDGVDRSSGAIDIGAYEFTGTPLASCEALNPPPAGPTPDTLKPVLKITKKPKKTTNSLKVKVSFSSNEAGSTFMCKLDKGSFKKCRSPYKKTVKPGKHKLRIYAIDAAGNKSSTSEIGWLANKKK